MWPVALSGRLPVEAMVGRCPAIQLIGGDSIPCRPKPFLHLHAEVQHIRHYHPFPGAIPVQGAGWSPVTHPFATLMESKLSNPVRLACVKHAASVRPEPESNSPPKSETLSGEPSALENEIGSFGGRSPPAQKHGAPPRGGAHQTWLYGSLRRFRVGALLHDQRF